MKRTQIVVVALLVAAAVAVFFLAPTTGAASYRVPLMAAVGVVLLVFLVITAFRARTSTGGQNSDERDGGVIDLTDPGEAAASTPDVVYKVVLHDSPERRRHHGDAWMMWAADMLEGSDAPGSSVDADASARTVDPVD